jgi:PAS domain S-box-containing protein
LSAIVEDSDDAIVGKDLNGIVASWNGGAERLFGYAPLEMIGKAITLLMPPYLQSEEPEILNRIRRGERVDHYETVRVRKDGTLVDISLTVSPVRDASGEIVGALKIARDITDRKRAQDRPRPSSLVRPTHRMTTAVRSIASVTCAVQGATTASAPVRQAR